MGAQVPGDVIVTRDPLTPGPQTTEGQFTGIVTFLAAFFVLAVAQGWVHVDKQTQDFVLQWLPIVIPALVGAYVAARTWLKAHVGAAQAHAAAAQAMALSARADLVKG